LPLVLLPVVKKKVNAGFVIYPNDKNIRINILIQFKEKTRLKHTRLLYIDLLKKCVYFVATEEKLKNLKTYGEANQLHDYTRRDSS
jgi:hypothetical protein